LFDCYHVHSLLPAGFISRYFTVFNAPAGFE
jgi:hypothetical protein